MSCQYPTNKELKNFELFLDVECAALQGSEFYNSLNEVYIELDELVSEYKEKISDLEAEIQELHSRLEELE